MEIRAPCTPLGHPGRGEDANAANAAPSPRCGIALTEGLRCLTGLVISTCPGPAGATCGRSPLNTGPVGQLHVTRRRLGHWGTQCADDNRVLVHSGPGCLRRVLVPAPAPHVPKTHALCRKHPRHERVRNRLIRGCRAPAASPATYAKPQHHTLDTASSKRRRKMMVSLSTSCFSFSSGVPGWWRCCQHASLHLSYHVGRSCC